MPHATEDIRNVALCGDSGVGKTMLAEALLFRAGAIPAKGNVARGTTVCDHDPQEKKAQHSLDVSACHFESGSSTVNLLDTPGSTDFAGRTLAALAAVDTVAVVVSAANGAGPIARRMMEAAKARGLCRIIVINGLDKPDARPAEVLAELRETFGRECLPLNLPAEGGTAVRDCFFQPAGGPTDFSSVAKAHKDIVEQVVEIDEELMERYLEQGEDLRPEQLHDPFETALREGHLIPVCFCSPETDAGVDELLRVFAELAPNPIEGNPPPFMKGEGKAAERVEVKPDPAGHVLAHVFKVVTDPFVGKLGYLRVHQGTLKAGAQVFVGDGRKPVRIGHIYRLQGKDHVDVPAAVPGDIVAVPKVDELAFDAVVHDSHDEDQYHLRSVEFPPPMLGLALEPTKRGDEQKLSEALHRAMAEDPCVRVEHTANETVLYGLGEAHLRVVLERMTERSSIALNTRPPSIPYRETVTKQAAGHHRHKKQTGGAGQFGEVFLRIEPLERGAGFEFVDEVVGGAIPSHFMSAVEKGIRQALAQGAIAGFPMQDLRAIVYDGKSHPVDSKEVAFISAARKALQNAALAAGPVVLEPVVRLEVTIPAAAIGAIAGDLSSRRGRVTGNVSLPGGQAQIIALAPLSEVSDYASKLKSLTGGDGSYTLDLASYDPVPPRKQEELRAAFRPAADDD